MKIAAVCETKIKSIQKNRQINKIDHFNLFGLVIELDLNFKN